MTDTFSRRWRSLPISCTDFPSAIIYIYQSKYQKVQAFTDVSCDFEVGKFYVIVGQSGSGKTTLLSILAGLGMPNEV